MDKLFKNKLENHAIPPAAQSWDKVESRLSKKNNLAIVIRAAAVIAIAGLLTLVIVNQTKQASPELAKEVVKAPLSAPVQQQTPIAESPGVVPSQPSQIQHAPLTKRTVHEKSLATEATSTPEPVVNEVQQEIQQQLADVPAKETKTRRVVLIYTLPTITKKAETPAVAVAVTQEEKSGFQKVIDVAIEVRNSDPLGELREAKDDLFALEFRKDKNKSKNQ